MNKTKIDWATMSWNPVTGCRHGCPYCYARRTAHRFDAGLEDDKAMPGGLHVLDSKIKATPYPFGFEPTLHRYRLNLPERTAEPQTVFVCSMADLFGKWVPTSWIVEVLDACQRAPQHRYLFLTKNPARYMESNDAAARRTLGETGGLGTVATRADIIEKLFHSFLIEKKGQEILVTSKGRQLLSLVPEDLKKPELTADWEMRLARIARGEHQEKQFLQDIESYTKDLIREIKTSEGTFRHDNLTNAKCPRCGKRLLSVNGKNARLLVCQDRECGYRETVARLSNARCPNCHKKMELIKKGEEETFVCSCGYKEKLSAFKKRREKEGAGVSKKDVQRYLKNQQTESVGNSFAAALSGIKIDPDA